MLRFGNTKIVQDNIREVEMIELFGLIKGDSREGVDATCGIGSQFELKSYSKPSVSTARDLGYKHLSKWASRYWLFGRFTNHDEGHRWHSFHFMAPNHMNAWFEKVRSKLDESHALIEQIAKALEPQFDSCIIDDVRKLMADGALLNDPNISAKYVRENGIEITGNFKDRINELVSEFPILCCNTLPTKIDDSLQFFSFK